MSWNVTLVIIHARKWKKTSDKVENFCTICMDLWKASDIINQVKRSNTSNSN